MAIDSLSIGPTGFSIGGGSSSVSKQSRLLRKEYEYRDRYAGRGIQAQVQGYRDAGLHPLFAMGAGGSQAPVFDMPGQAASGSHADLGIQIASEAAKADIEATTKNKELQNQLLQIEIDNLKRTGGGNDIDPRKAVDLALGEMKEKGSVITHKVPPKVQSTEGIVELKPAEQLTNAPGQKQTLAADMSIRRKLWYTNDKYIWIPNVQELDALLEEPLVSAGIIATMNPTLSIKDIREILSGQQLRVGQTEKNLKYEAPFGLFKIYKGK